MGPYLEVVAELETHMVASQRSIKNVQRFYKQQKVNIQNADANRQKLEEMEERCKNYKITITMLRDHEKEKDESLTKKIADIEEKEKVLLRAKEEAENYQVELKKDKENFNKKVKASEAAQKVKLHEQRAKLVKEQDEEYKKRVEALKKQTKVQQDDADKRIFELKSKNEELGQKLEEQKSKLKQVESRCKDAEKLKTIYEKEGEKLREDLKMAENEFALETGTTEF